MARSPRRRRRSRSFPATPTRARSSRKLVETTRDNGLPIDPIVAKVQYGVASCTPSRRGSSRRRAQIAARLEIARDALAPATASDITAGAQTRSVTARRRKRCVPSASRAAANSVATPLGVLAQLLGSNVPLKRATEIVTSFIKPRRDAGAARGIRQQRERRRDARRGRTRRTRYARAVPVRRARAGAATATAAGTRSEHSQRHAEEAVAQHD